MQSRPASEERERFSEAGRAHSSAMFRCARALLGSDADAEDAVSEAVLKAWQAWGNLRKPKAVKTWLLKIAVNCAYEQLRKNCRMLYTEDLTPYEQAEEAQEPVYDLWCAVERLEEHQRTVVVLFYYEECTIREIAQVLEVSPGTVKSRLSRAREKLKQMLREEGNCSEQGVG